MKVSSMISALAWASAIMLAWFVAIDRVQFNPLVLSVWIFFIFIGIGAGFLSVDGR